MPFSRRSESLDGSDFIAALDFDWSGRTADRQLLAGIDVDRFGLGRAQLAPGLRASVRFTMWLIVFLVVALLPCFAVWRGLFNVDTSVLPIAAQTGFSLHLNSAWAFGIEGVWVLASLLSLARLSINLRHMRGLLRNSLPVPFADLGQQIQPVVSRTGKRPVEVRLSDAVDAPSVIGFFHPAVVLPRSLWSELAQEDLKQIILHEMAHLTAETIGPFCCRNCYGPLVLESRPVWASAIFAGSGTTATMPYWMRPGMLAPTLLA